MCNIVVRVRVSFYFILYRLPQRCVGWCGEACHSFDADVHAVCKIKDGMRTQGLSEGVRWNCKIFLCASGRPELSA